MCGPVEAAVAGAVGNVASGMIQGNRIDKATAQSQALLGEAQETATGHINQGAQLGYAALAQAMSVVKEGQAKAEAALRAGNQEAARLAIEGAKLTARGILDAANVAATTMANFFNYANSVLTPTIDLGNFAANEQASMLGIPGHDGNIVPFDTDKLLETPGAQFRRSEMDRTLQNTAAFKELSSQQMNRAQERANQLAEAEFGTRFNQLNTLAGRGASHENTLAQLAGNTGTNIGTMQANAGARAAQALGSGFGATADLLGNQGANLANLYTGTAGQLANIHQQQGNVGISQQNALAQLAFDTAAAQAGLNNAQAQQKNQTTAGIFDGLGGIASTIGTFAKPVGSTSSGFGGIG